jgi:hypothetical protein
MNKIHFITECWAETMLVRILFLQGKHRSKTGLYDHAVGISDVPKIMHLANENFIT